MCNKILEQRHQNEIKATTAKELTGELVHLNHECHELGEVREAQHYPFMLIRMSSHGERPNSIVK